MHRSTEYIKARASAIRNTLELIERRCHFVDPLAGASAFEDLLSSLKDDCDIIPFALDEKQRYDRRGRRINGTPASD